MGYVLKDVTMEKKKKVCRFCCYRRREKVQVQDRVGGCVGAVGRMTTLRRGGSASGSGSPDRKRGFSVAANNRGLRLRQKLGLADPLPIPQMKRRVTLSRPGDFDYY